MCSEAFEHIVCESGFIDPKGRGLRYLDKLYWMKSCLKFLEQVALIYLLMLHLFLLVVNYFIYTLSSVIDRLL